MAQHGACYHRSYPCNNPRYILAKHLTIIGKIYCLPIGFRNVTRPTVEEEKKRQLRSQILHWYGL
jgi:hypothetical protein